MRKEAASVILKVYLSIYMHRKLISCLVCTIFSTSNLKRTPSSREEHLYNQRVTFSMTFSLMNIHPRNEATWLPGIFLPQNFWLCSLFVHLDSRKTLQLFPSSIYWFLLCMEMALEDLHIYQSFSNQNTYTYACMHKKVFLALISLHLLYIKLKLESFLLFMHTQNVQACIEQKFVLKSYSVFEQRILSF